MSSCLNRKFGDKLYAYELGMLSDEERNEFEIHLLECAFCSEKALKFHSPARLLRHDSDVQDVIRRLDEEEPYTAVSSDTPQPRNRRRKWLTFVPIPAIFLIVLIFVILKPWHVEFKPTNEVIAAQTRLAIVYFDNLADHEDAQRLGEIATNLLITDLSESRYIGVVSSQRLYDILKLLGKEGERNVDKYTALEIARKSGAKNLLTGSILQVEPNIVITTQLVDVLSGKVEASQRVTGGTNDDIFSMVDKLTVEIKTDLSLPYAAMRESDRPIAEVTTHSPESYRNYLKGVALYNRFYMIEAAESFEKALEFDSTFAMVYYYLSELTSPDLIDKALEYSDKAGEMDRYFIKSREAIYSRDYDKASAELEEAIMRFPEEKLAYFMLGSLKHSLRQYLEAISNLKEAIRIDPLYKSAYNVLAYSYTYADSAERAIQTIDLYISLTPDEANPYDSKADIMFILERYDEAIDSYRKALAIKPDFYHSYGKLCKLHLLRREYAEAESCAVILADADDMKTRSDGRQFLALIPLHRGQIGQALDMLDNGISIDSIELTGLGRLRTVSKHYVKARIYSNLHKHSMAVKEIEKGIEIYRLVYPNDKGAYRCFYTSLLVRNGEYEKAEQVHSGIVALQNETGLEEPYFLYGAAFIELSRGNPERALDSLRKYQDVKSDMDGQFILGRTLLDLGKYDEAETVFDELCMKPEFWLSYYGFIASTRYYYAGLAHEKAGNIDKAIGRYEEFLDIWVDADSGVAELEDAKVRLVRLKTNP